jgi:RNA polymerase sigma-70 factor (ECF subfamily)
VNPDPSDRALAARVVSDGDEDAFRLLYRRHTPALFRIASRLSPAGGPTAEDLVQETWIRAADRLGAFEWRSGLATWLAGILLNRIREELRARRRDRADPLDPLAEHPAREAPLDDRLDLRDAIAALPAGYRTVLVLHDVEGYRHGEIAELLGCDVGTSKSQLSRARRALRRWLEPGWSTA